MAKLLFFVLTRALRQKDGWLYLTRKGQYYWVIMMREFFIGVNNFRITAVPWLGRRIKKMGFRV